MRLHPPHFISWRQRGFTLVEVIISAGLIGFLAVGATWYWVDSFRLVRTVDADSAAIADARAALERAAREIREVKYDSLSGNYCISTLGASQIVFNKTRATYVSTCAGASPDLASNDVAVTIGASSGTLNMTLLDPSATPSTLTRALTAHASSFGIRYLDANYATTTGVNAVRYVELSLTVQRADTAATVARTVVALRNN